MSVIAFVSWIAGLIGFTLLVTGVALISVPVGLIVAGVLLLFWSYLADRASAGMAHAAQQKE